MSDKNSVSGVQNVGCCVKECKYHSAMDLCNARRIEVENAEAHRKGETFCSTFENKSSL